MYTLLPFRQAGMPCLIRASRRHSATSGLSLREVSRCRYSRYTAKRIGIAEPDASAAETDRIHGGHRKVEIVVSRNLAATQSRDPA